MMHRTALLGLGLLASACATPDAGPPSDRPPPDPAGGPVCGDGVRQEGEECDGNDIGDWSCALLTYGAKPGGTPTCTAACRIDHRSCTAEAPRPRDRSEPTLEAVVADALEIDVEALGCEDVDAQLLRCPCTDRICERALERIDLASDAYTAGRGERAWADRWVLQVDTGNLEVLAYGDPVRYVEIRVVP